MRGWTTSLRVALLAGIGVFVLGGFVGWFWDSALPGSSGEPVEAHDLLEPGAVTWAGVLPMFLAASCLGSRVRWVAWLSALPPSAVLAWAFTLRLPHATESGALGEERHWGLYVSLTGLVIAGCALLLAAVVGSAARPDPTRATETAAT